MSETLNHGAVLIVEEEPAVQVILDAILRKNGFRTLRARSGKEAAEIAERHFVPIDVILTNIEVEGDSGPDLVEKLRQIRQNLQVVYISATVADGAVQIKLMRQLGPDYFITAGDAGIVNAVRNAMAVSTLRAGA